MGKYPNSDIHQRYSDWHWYLVKQDPKFKRLYQADIDRLWLEYDFLRNEVIAVLDIKWEDIETGLSPTEKGVYDWFERQGCMIYTVYISRDFNKFHVWNSNGKLDEYDSLGYANFLLSLRGLTAVESPLQPNLI